MHGRLIAINNWSEFGKQCYIVLLFLKNKIKKNLTWEHTENYLGFFFLRFRQRSVLFQSSYDIVKHQGITKGKKKTASGGIVMPWKSDVNFQVGDTGWQHQTAGTDPTVVSIFTEPCGNHFTLVLFHMPALLVSNCCCMNTEYHNHRGEESHMSLSHPTCRAKRTDC